MPTNNTVFNLLEKSEPIVAKALLSYQSELNIKDTQQKNMFEQIEIELNNYYQFGNSILNSGFATFAVYDYQKTIHKQLSHPKNLNEKLQTEYKSQLNIINQLVQNDLI